MRKVRGTTLSGMIVPLMLAGCAQHPARCDPRQADVDAVTKAQCLFSGEYARRHTEKQALLADQMRLNALFQDAYAAIQDEQSRVTMETVSSVQKMSAISTSVTQLLAALAGKSIKDKQLAGQVKEIRERMIRLQNQPGVSPLQQRQTLAELMVNVTDLQKTLDLR